MLKLHQFVKAGEATACASFNFIKKIKSRLPMFQDFTSDEAFQDHIIRVFESVDRWEYIVIDDKGETLAVMAIAIEPYDQNKGEPVIQTLLAGSLKDGLLTDAYKLMVNLAKENKIKWVCFSKTIGQEQIWRYKKIFTEK